MALCVTVPLFVTVCVPDVSVVTAAPNIRYLVLAQLDNGAEGAVTVALVLLYTAIPTVTRRLVTKPGQ